MIYQNENLEYTNAEAYDKRGEFSILENYILNLWRPFLKKIIKNLSIGKTVVDLGCGTCEYAEAAQAAKKIYVVDISAPMLGACREKLKDFINAEFIQAPVEEVDLPENLFDLVITIGVWEYVEPAKLFETVKKITHRGSKVIVVFPNCYNDFHWLRSLIKRKWTALSPRFMRKLFAGDFTLLDQASFGIVSLVPERLQFLALPFWRFSDWLWQPLQKFLPLGANVYYLFEKK